MSKQEIAPTEDYLKHKAAISTRDYYKHDGEFAPNTDARVLSIGLSTYEDEKYISAKVWRRGQYNWSRQSEDLPLHRVLDLSIMIISALVAKKTGKLENHYLDLEYIKDVDLQTFHQYLNNQRPELDERLQEISLMLKKYNNSI